MEHSNLRSALAANCLDKLARFFQAFRIMKTTIPPVLITFSLVCFALVQNTRAVSPAPDGGYAGGNTAEGTNALFSLTGGVWKTGLGFQTLYHTTTGNQNTATGYQTLFSNTTGSLSTAYGSQALYNNTTGNSNAATGFRTLFSNTTGSKNTGNGYRALLFNSTGRNNTASGFNTLYSNRTGDNNTATGSEALVNNQDGSGNTANGFQALHDNTSSFNTAIGNQTLYNSYAAYGNTAVGNQAIFTNIDGNYNTAIGDSALHDNIYGTDNTTIGWYAGYNITGDGNICIGSGAYGVAGESGTIRIGGYSGYNACYINGIYGQGVDPYTSQAAYVSESGKLGTVVSSQRFKRDIKPMDRISDAILALKPVTFHYLSDAKNTPCFGLIAEQVAEVNPNLVIHDKSGEVLSVRYDAVNAMLLNEFLKAHRKMEEQEATIAELKKDFGATIAQLTARLNEQASQIQKVTAQLAAASPSGGGLEASKPAPQVVNNNQ
jgi:Chaperone of endosialidase